MLHLDIFIVLVVLGVYNVISQMLDYPHANKTRVKQSHEYRRYYDRHHVTRLQKQIKKTTMIYIHYVHSVLVQYRIKRFFSGVHACVNGADAITK